MAHVFYVRLHIINPGRQNVGVRTVILAHGPCRNTHTHTHSVRATTLTLWVCTSNKATRTKPSESSEDFFFTHPVVTKESGRRKRNAALL